MTTAGEDLVIESLGKARRDAEGRSVAILSDVDLVVPAERLTVVIGPSGGGKSTLLRLLNRLEEPTSGRILLAGVDIATLDPLLLRRRVGSVPQVPYMYEGTVLENLQRPFVFRGVSPPSGTDGKLLETLELCRLSGELLDRQARSLSVGQQQRVGLARALLAAPGLLLLDEPTSALDRPTADQLGDALREIRRERRLTLLMMTHDLRLARRVADRAAFLDGGRILEEGDAEAFFTAPRDPALRRFLANPKDFQEDRHDRWRDGSVAG